jgi:acyl-CoA synthetase (AMP-forming)/AMP-acid ligase II
MAVRAEFVASGSRWPMRFTAGEREARAASGEWPGQTIGDMARVRASEDPDVTAISGETGGRTYTELLADAEALARGLLELGVERGETVSFQLPNWIESTIVNLACALGGFIVNPIIPIYRHSELRFILKDCQSRAIFIPDVFRSIDYTAMIGELRGEVPDLKEVIVVRGNATGLRTYDEIRAGGVASRRPLVPPNADDAKFIIYTSGTTGLPKGAIYSHNQSRRPVWASREVWGFRKGSKQLAPSPVTHVSGYLYGLESPLHFGVQVTFMEKWDAMRALEIIDKEQTDFMHCATPFLQELVERAEQNGRSLPSLRLFACGGAAVPPELIRRANRVFVNCRTFRVYGSTECPMITQGALTEPELAATTDGQVFDWDVKVVNDSGQRVNPGEEGEILARGPSMFRGYTNMTANEEAFDSEGYFRMGDLGTVSVEGMLTVTGRKKDLIIRGGENLSAKEIEDVLHTHPTIREAAVVAMPHQRLGEAVCAYIIPVGAERPDAMTFAAFLHARGLAKQKYPERVEYVDELPKTASGKVQKHILRRMIGERIAAENKLSSRTL